MCTKLKLNVKFFCELFIYFFDTQKLVDKKMAKNKIVLL